MMVVGVCELDLHIPGCRSLKEKQIRHLPGHVFALGQPRVFITGSVSGDRAGLGHHVAHRFGTQVRAAGRAFGSIHIHRDAKATVALVLDGFDFTQPHADAQTLLQADVGLGLPGTGGACLGQRESHRIGEFLDS
jgi:hypothetical protein